MPRSLPPGWPREVPPPGVDGWQVRATAWLLDQCPPEYRAESTLVRHPRVLARFAAWHIQGAQGGATRALAQVRTSLAGAVGPQVVAAAITVAEREAARLALVDRSVRVVGQALDSATEP